MSIFASIAGHRMKTRQMPLTAALMLALAVTFLSIPIFGQDDHDGKRIADVVVTLEGNDNNPAVAEQFRALAREAVGAAYSAVRIRDAIEQLYATKRIASVVVEAEPSGADSVTLRFITKRKTQALSVKVEVVDAEGDRGNVTEQELLFRLTLLDPGAVVTEQTLRENATLIQDYLRERGYFKAEVTYTQQPIANANEVGVTFRVVLNQPATVNKFEIQIEGIDNAIFKDKLLLEPGETFSRDKLNRDEEKIREILRNEGYLAPTLSPARPVYDSDANTIDITVV